MEKRLAFPTVLILLVVAAGALGRAQGARAHRGSSAQTNAALTVKAYGGLARRGFPVYLAFRVQAAGAVKVRLTMRLPGGALHVLCRCDRRRGAPREELRLLPRRVRVYANSSA